MSNVGSAFYDEAMEDLITEWERRLSLAVEELGALANMPVPPFGAAFTSLYVKEAQDRANTALHYVRSGRPS